MTHGRPDVSVGTRLLATSCHPGCLLCMLLSSCGHVVCDAFTIYKGRLLTQLAPELTEPCTASQATVTVRAVRGLSSRTRRWWKAASGRLQWTRPIVSGACPPLPLDSAKNAAAASCLSSAR